MAKYQNEVNYKITTTFDKSGITQLQTQLSAVEAKFKEMAAQNAMYGPNAYAQDIKRITTLKSLITKNFNSSTGLLNTQGLMTGLNKAGMSLATLQKSMSNAGAVGNQAFNGLIQKTATFQKGIKQVSTLGEKLGTTFGNTVRWGVTAMAFQSIMSAASEAVSYVKELDQSLTQITMVSGESRDNMKEFAKYANEAASSLSASTTTYTNAVKVFIQEGFSLEESNTQAKQATTLANVSEQDSSTTADEITAYRNAFGLSIDEMNNSLDKVASLANNTASNVSELMTASQKAASTAASVGASEDSFLASVATIESVTRESAENIGNGLKSVYTRLSDVKMGSDTEDGVSYGQYSSALKSAGVDILDSNGEVKNMDTILSELQSVWSTLSDSKKEAVGEKVAGRYQYNRFAALMNNKDYYDKAYSATQNASGTMDEMEENYEESYTAKGQQIATNFQTLWTQIYSNTDIVDNLVNGMVKLSDVMAEIFKHIDNGVPVIAGLSALIMKFAGKQIAGSFSNMLANTELRKSQAATEAQRRAAAKETLQGKGMYAGIQGKNVNAFIQNTAQNAQYTHALTNEQLEQQSALESEIIEKLNVQEENKEKLSNITRDITNQLRQGTLTEAEQSEIEIGIEEKNAEIDELLEKQKQNQNMLNEEDKSRLANLRKTVAYDQTRLDKNEQLRGILKEQSNLFTKYNAAKGQGFKAEEEVLEQFTVATLKADSSLRELNQTANIMATTEEKNNSVVIASREGLETYVATLQEAVDSGLLNTDSQKAYEVVINKVRAGLAQSNEELAKNDTYWRELADAINKASAESAKEISSLQRLCEGLKIDEKALTELMRKCSMTDAQIEALIGSMAEFRNAAVTNKATLMALNETIMAGSMSIMNFAMGFSSIKSLISDFGDESKTAGEKFESLLTNGSMLAMTVPMMVSGFSQMKKGLAGLGASASLEIGEATTASIFGSTAAGAEAAATAKLTDEIRKEAAAKAELAIEDALGTKNAKKTIAAGAEAAATAKLTKEIRKEAAAKAKLAIEDALGTKNAKKTTAAKAIETGSIKKQTKALGQNTKAWIQNKIAQGKKVPGKALNTLGILTPVEGKNTSTLNLKPLGSVFAAIAVTAAAAAAAVKIYDYQTTSASRNAEKQAASLSTLKNNSESLSSSYSNLSSKITEITDASDSLDDMTKGTQEWATAVQKLNIQVLQLIQSYPQLKEAMTMEDGHWSLDEDKVNDILQEENDKTLAASNAALIQQNVSERANTSKEIEEAYNEGSIFDDGSGLTHNESGEAITGTVATAGGIAGGVAGTLAAGAATGAAAGSVVPGIGTVIGAGVGALGAGLLAMGITSSVSTASESELESGINSLAESIATTSISATEATSKIGELASQSGVAADKILELTESAATDYMTKNTDVALTTSTGAIDDYTQSELEAMGQEEANAILESGLINHGLSDVSVFGNKLNRYDDDKMLASDDFKEWIANTFTTSEGTTFNASAITEIDEIGVNGELQAKVGDEWITIANSQEELEASLAAYEGSVDAMTEGVNRDTAIIEAFGGSVEDGDTMSSIFTENNIDSYMSNGVVDRDKIKEQIQGALEDAARAEGLTESRDADSEWQQYITEGIQDAVDNAIEAADAKLEVEAVLTYDTDSYDAYIKSLKLEDNQEYFETTFNDQYGSTDEEWDSKIAKLEKAKNSKSQSSYFNDLGEEDYNSLNNAIENEDINTWNNDNDITIKKGKEEQYYDAVNNINTYKNKLDTATDNTKNAKKKVKRYASYFETDKDGNFKTDDDGNYVWKEGAISSLSSNNANAGTAMTTLQTNAKKAQDELTSATEAQTAAQKKLNESTAEAKKYTQDYADAEQALTKAQEAQELEEQDQNNLRQRILENQQGFNDLSTAIDDYYSKLNSDNYVDKMNAQGYFQNALAEMSGLEATDFTDEKWFSTENVSLYKEAVNGVTSAVEKLNKKLGEAAIEKYFSDGTKAGKATVKTMKAALSTLLSSTSSMKEGKTYNAQTKSKTKEGKAAQKYLKAAADTVDATKYTGGTSSQKYQTAKAQAVDNAVQAAAAAGKTITGIKYNVTTKGADGKDETTTYSSLEEAQAAENEALTKDQTSAINTQTANSASYLGSYLASIDTNLANYINNPNAKGATTATTTQNTDAASEILNGDYTSEVDYSGAKITDTGTTTTSGADDSSSSSSSSTNKLDRQRDAYKKLDEVVEQIKNNLDQLNTLSERLWGKKKLKSLKDIIKETKTYTSELKKQANSQYSDLQTQRYKNKDINGKKTVSSYGVEFDKYGNITDASYKKTEAKLYKAWKNASKDDKDDAETAYNDFVSAVSDYEDDLSTWYETMNSIVEQYQTLEDTQASYIDHVSEINEALQTCREGLLSLSNMSSKVSSLFGSKLTQSFSDLQSSVNSLSEYSTSTQWKNINGGLESGTVVEKALEAVKDTTEQSKIYNKYIAKYDAEIEALEAKSQLTASQEQDLVRLYAEKESIAAEKGYIEGSENDLEEELSTTRDNLKTIMESYQSSIEDLESSISTAADSINSTMDGFLTRYENVVSHLQNTMTLLSSVTGYIGDNASDLQADILKQQLATQKASLKETLSAVKTSKSLEDSVKEDSELYATQSDKTDEYQDKVTTSLSDIVETLQSILENDVTTAFDDFFSAFGIEDIEWTQESWDLQKKTSEGMYDDVERGYQIQKLQLEYQELLNDSSSSAANIQEEITSQMNEQISLLENKNDLSEYDVSYAEKQLDILKAQIALQEAQTNKTKLQLQRDTSGNYSYVYTADDDAVAEAQEKLLEAQENAYELSKETLANAQENAISALSDMYSKIKEIMTDTNLDASEKMERVQEVYSSYMTYLGNLEDQAGISFGNISDDISELGGLIQIDFQNQDFSDLMNSIDTSGFATELGNELNVSFFKALSDEDKWSTAGDALVTALNKSAVAYDDEISKLLAESGYKSLSAFIAAMTTQAADDTKDITEDISSTTSQIQESVSSIDKNMSTLTTAISKFQEMYEQVYAAYKASSKQTASLAGVALDSGGYTGTWSDATAEKKNGKLAFLHQKELVLNATDTENILSAVEFVRQMKSDGMSAGVSTDISKVAPVATTDTIEQRVNIEATFPNATDASEIKSAIMSLADNAYQYVNRSY